MKLNHTQQFYYIVLRLYSEKDKQGNMSQYYFGGHRLDSDKKFCPKLVGVYNKKLFSRCGDAQNIMKRLDAHFMDAIKRDAVGSYEIKLGKL